MDKYNDNTIILTIFILLNYSNNLQNSVTNKCKAPDLLSSLPALNRYYSVPTTHWHLMI